MIDQVIKKYQPLLLHLAIKCTGNSEDAKDLYQETLIKLYLNQGKYKEEGNLKAYSCKILKNIHNTEFTRRKASKNTIDPYYLADNRDRIVYNEGESNFEIENIKSLLQQFPDKTQNVIFLKSQGFTQEEIGQKLGVNSSYAKTCLNTKKFSKLRNLLSATYKN